MRSENYVAFFTVSGFFIGLIFSMIKYNDVLEFLFATFVITLFFYLFIHVVLTFFIKSDDKDYNYFDKSYYESYSNEQIDLIKHREEKITTLLKSINEV